MSLISLEITASGFSPQTQGLKRKELWLEDWDSGVFTHLKEQGLSEVHHEACKEVAGVWGCCSGFSAVSSSSSPEPQRAASSSPAPGNLITQLQPPTLVGLAPELGWLLILQRTQTCLCSHQMLYHEQRQRIQC